MVIVGGGPVGLCAAVAFGRAGVPFVLVERHSTLAPFPRGRAVSTRTMELFRRWGLAEDVLAAALPAEKNLAFFVGETLTASEFVRGAPVPGPFSPVFTTLCAQEVLEPILRRHAERYAPGSLQFGTEVTRVVRDGDRVIAWLVDEAGRDRSVSGRYLIGADGGDSLVRGACGVPLDGPDTLCRNVNILFEADLRAAVADRLSLMYTVAGGYFMAVDNDRRWLLNLVNPTGSEDLADAVRAAVGLPDLEVRVLGYREWTARAQLARWYRAGPVFLAGDAAHPMTPYGGFGMNCGIQDVDNLVWKLAAVCGGWASERLLDTYELERRPVGHRSVMESQERLLDELNGVRRPRPSDGLALGYAYESPVVIPDGTPPPEGDPVADFVPTTRPGHRLPHVWLELGGRWVSTLDLVGPDFTLLVGPGGHAWLAALDRVRDGIPVRGLAIDPVAELELPADGALLVRPDGHVAWRAATAGDGPAAVLAAVLPACAAGNFRAPAADLLADGAH